MGSVSVYTGHLTKTEVTSILEGRVSAKKNGEYLELPEAIRIFPNNLRSSRGESFIVDFDGVPMDVRRKFLSLWKGRANTQDRNATGSYNSAYDKAIKAGATPEEARVLAEEARTRTTKTAMQNILSKNPNAYGKTEILTLDEYNRKHNIK